MQFDHGLNIRQLNIIKAILKPYAQFIDRVSIFGSRATGKYHEYSDIDMVIYGTLEEKKVDRISTLLSDSDLPYKVDLLSYNLIAYPALKEHIDNLAKTLFTGNELISS